MIKVISYIVKENYTKIEWEQTVNPSMVGPMIPRGCLEQYMGAYGFSAEETLSYILADILYEDIDVPFLEDPEAEAKITELLRRIEGRIEWGVDKHELLSKMVLDPELAEHMKATWSELRTETVASEVQTAEQVSQALKARAEAYVSGHQLRQEELLADDMMEAYKPQPATLDTPLIPPERLN